MANATRKRRPVAIMIFTGIYRRATARLRRASLASRRASRRSWRRSPNP